MLNLSKSPQIMEHKIKLTTLNPHIICNICEGYLIDATAITECLHTFCKSCIIKHLEANTYCPTCKITIHHSYPRQYINFDRTMQDIVYKLVPNLYENEMKREQEFYKQRGLLNPKENHHCDDNSRVETSEIANNLDRRDELINVCLNCCNNSNNNNNRVAKLFVRVPTKTTIQHLKRFILTKLSPTGDISNKIQIFYNNNLLNNHDSLKYICLMRINSDEVPFLLLHYRL